MKGILRYMKGMFKDTSPMDQPPGTVRFARNALLNRTTGAYTNAPGSRSVDTSDGTRVGTIELPDERTVIFSLNTFTGRSEIGVFSNEVYKVVLNIPLTFDQDTDLKFSLNNPIEGTFSQQPDGDIILYWTDDLNPPRTLNLTRQEQSSSNRLYGIDPATSNDTAYIDRLNLFPHSGPVPHSVLHDVAMGGDCRTGVYYLALGYTDEDLIETDHVTVSNPVSISDDPQDVSVIESYDGAEPGTPSGKLITWRVTNINTDLPFLKATVLIRLENELSAVRIRDIRINGRDTIDIAFSGAENYATSSPEDVVIDHVRYRTAKTMTQLDSTLYLGNLTSQPDLGYQKYANFITLRPTTEKFSNFDPYVPSTDFLHNRKGGAENDRTQGYRDAFNMAEKTGYTRNEVYAFYIAFVLKDGTLSYAYHIPGRAPLTTLSESDIPERINYGGSVGGNFDERDPLSQSALSTTDMWDIISTCGGPVNDRSRFYQWFDTSTAPNSGGMGYWENLNEDYPDTEDYDVIDASDPNTVQSSLREENVRHHKFPSNSNPAYTTIRASTAGQFTTSTRTRPVIHWYWFGGMDTHGPVLTPPSSATLEGMHASNSYSAAQQWQVDEGFVTQGNSMGDGGSGEIATGMESCYPPNNTALLASLPLLGCAGNVEDVAFVYDTQIPSGVTVMVGYDMTDSSSGFNSHCGNIGFGTVTSVSGDTVELNTIGSGLPPGNIAKLPGWVAWVECEEIVGTDSEISHEVDRLGFYLEDLKIPRSIADQVQGFRIYYAERTHENRTVLGQAPIHNMYKKVGVDVSGCDGGGVSRGLVDYWLASGQPSWTTPNERVFSFHDFYLLNRRPELSSATHLRLQYELKMLNYKGSTEYYIDAQNTDIDDAIYSCLKPQVRTSFHALGDVTPYSGALNYVLEDKAKVYIPGGEFLSADDKGFGDRIYNVGGETLIGLRTGRFTPYVQCEYNAPWRDLRTDGAKPSFTDYGETLRLQQVNLQAFKTDVYNTVDTQTLVWTGYEVLGESLNNFIVEDDGSQGAPAQNFTTGGIFGGDTYICRYGYRMSHREEISSTAWGSWVGGNDPVSQDHKSVIYTIVESTENINMRHSTNEDNFYFPGNSLSEVLRQPANIDLTSQANLLYNEAYSSLNNIKPPIPLPFQVVQPTDHPNDVIRSIPGAGTELFDNYRYFQAGQLRSLDRNKGELWKLIAYNNDLYFHLEDGLFRTKGKQRMKLEDGEEAFIGDGDIFAQRPDLVRTSESGILGTRSQWATSITPYGYFYVDNRNREVHVLADRDHDISSELYGMYSWFKENLPFLLEDYGFVPDIDNPIKNMGFHSVWDERNRRVILTKNELVPTEEFTNRYAGVLPLSGPQPANPIAWDPDIAQYVEVDTGTPITLEDQSDLRAGLFTPSGWTISFTFGGFLEGRIGVWTSFHDHVPYMYFHSKDRIYAFDYDDTSIYHLNNTSDMGAYFGTQYSFELDLVHNFEPELNKQYIAFNWTADVYQPSQKEVQKELHAGFTSYMGYNSTQHTGEVELEYLINLRKVDSTWRAHDLRDISTEVTDTDTYYTGPHSGSNFGIPGLNLAGLVTPGVPTNSDAPMFIVSGMYEAFNTAYVDTNKPWYLRGKLADRYLITRMIADNSTNDVIHLYTAHADYRTLTR